jgi:proline racemase
MIFIHTIDSHTAGEGTRLVTAGLPPLRGSTMGEKMADAQATLGWLPGAILLEPRGHKDLYGALLCEPCDPLADIGVVFMNNQGYEPMCGHGLIGVVTCLIETGVFAADVPEKTLLLDTPSGLVRAVARVEEKRVLGVAFENVPAFALQLDAQLLLADGKSLRIDIAFGGNFFALIDAGEAGVRLERSDVSHIAGLGMQILAAANEQFPVRHPQMSYLDRITDVRFYTAVTRLHSRNVVVLGNQMVDRSPCGTGTCAELAVRYARGLLLPGETLIAESILDTRFCGTVIREVESGYNSLPYPAIFPRVEGRAYLTGLHELLIDPDDPFSKGFLLS